MYLCATRVTVALALGWESSWNASNICFLNFLGTYGRMSCCEMSQNMPWWSGPNVSFLVAAWFSRPWVIYWVPRRCFGLIQVYHRRHSYSVDAWQGVSHAVIYSFYVLDVHGVLGQKAQLSDLTWWGLVWFLLEGIYEGFMIGAENNRAVTFNELVEIFYVIVQDCELPIVRTVFALRVWELSGKKS